MPWCHETVLVDGGTRDGTVDAARRLRRRDPASVRGDAAENLDGRDVDLMPEDEFQRASPTSRGATASRYAGNRKPAGRPTIVRPCEARGRSLRSLSPVHRRFLPAAAALAGAAGFAHAAPSVLILPAVSKVAGREVAGRGLPGHVALTFDDGPDPASTPSFLEALDRLGWRATFFMLGEMAARSPALAREVAAAGHEVAVHGYQHRSHLLRLPARVVADVRRSTEMIAGATGTSPRWLRPPYGHLATSTIVAARREGLRPVLWTVAGGEWRPGADTASVAETLCQRLHSGATVLLHDSDCTSPPGSARAALGALDHLREHVERARLSVGPLGEHFPIQLPGAMHDA